MPLIDDNSNIRINPIDLPQNDKIAVGIPFPFDAGGVFRQTFTTKEQVKSNLINLLLTDKGERPMMPTFGVGIRKLLFEQNIQKESLQSRIENAIAKYLPEVILNRLEIAMNKETHVLTIQLFYSVIWDRTVDAIELNFQ
jgi:uncharacterized protein|tara:strand:+ start:4384 stop:4803 length:420 start_codon:yes stop_codon:yes gene_type:complete